MKKNKLNFLKNRPVRFGFGFINLKLKKPNRTQTKNNRAKLEKNLAKINRAKTKPNRKNRAKPVWIGFCPKKPNQLNRHRSVWTGFGFFHYQKIDKYKRKYRGNISVGTFSRDFTYGNIPSVYTEGITVGKKIKTNKKKRWRVIFTNGITDGIFFVGKFVGKLWTLFIMSITKGITDGIFRRHFPESSRTVHFPIALLLLFFTDKITDGLKSRQCYLLVFWKNSINLKFSFKYYRRNHRRIEKSSVNFWRFLKKFYEIENLN